MTIDRELFERFAARKTKEAASANIQRLSTVFARRDGVPITPLGNAWSRAYYGGDFHVLAPAPARTAVSLVFVQTRSGNTGARDPGTLGGGATDRHLLYEGLSRVAADAVLAGAGSVHRNAFFSVWHPELVALRASLGLPRHPAQVVVTRQGRLDFDALLFNVPEVPTFLLAGPDAVARHDTDLRRKPWIRLIPLDSDDLRSALNRLRTEEQVQRISAIGGRGTATQLVDHGLAQDIYLTTTAREAGEPGTPWYAGTGSLRLDLQTTKEWHESAEPVRFDHLLIALTAP